MCCIATRYFLHADVYTTLYGNINFKFMAILVCNKIKKIVHKFTTIERRQKENF